MTLSSIEHIVAADAVVIGGYVQQGLAWLKANPGGVNALIAKVPTLAAFETTLLGLAPGVGEFVGGVELIDALIQDGPTLLAAMSLLGLHAPAPGGVDDQHFQDVSGEKLS